MSPYTPIAPANYKPLLTTVNAKWKEFYNQAPETWYQEVAADIPSTTKTEHYNWPSQVPNLEEWIGAVNFSALSSYQYTLTNKDWVRGIKLKAPDVDDNVLSGFWNAQQGLARAAKKLPDQQIALACQNGQTALGFDGVYFFSDSHPISPFAGGVTGTQQNYWNTGKALTFDNLTLIYNTMTNYRDDQNRPLGIVPDTILVPPQLQILAKRLTGATIADATVTGITMVGNQPNPLASMFKVVVAPELSADSTTWYLLDTSKVVKPFIWQQRQDTQFISKMGPGDPGKFYRNDYEFEATRRGAAGYGLWFTAAKAVG